MQRATILHMFTAAPNLSPFDVNMAVDAGWQHCIPYTGLVSEQIADLTQDAIFSRGPKGVKRTGIFVGGRDIHTAMDMLDAARKAMVPPFEVSVFADPSGAFTTAAGMVACVSHSTAIAMAGLMTAVVFGGLTVLVFVTRADLSWLGRYLGLAGIVALGFIVCSILFGLNLGNLFAALMVAFAAAYILYGTSNILHQYRLDQHVAASLALFASVALLFWYVLQLFMSRD